FEVDGGKELLDNLEEQENYIFVSKPIADEVMRRKLDCCAAQFSSNNIDQKWADLPYHLLGISDQEVSRFRSIFQDAKKSKPEKTKAKEEIQELAAKALPPISRSEDDVSKRLAPLFGKAVEPNSPEMGGARYRRELGNPPGKRWPLGDQITWEQLLTYCEKENVQRLWIITSDGDYVTKFGECVFLNPFLHQELKQTCGDGVEVRCFDNLMTAITD